MKRQKFCTSNSIAARLASTLPYASSETITHKMVLDYLQQNAEKVKEQFESMMTVLKRTIPKWELSGQGDGGHHADDDDDYYNPLKNRDDMDNILHDGGLSSSSESKSSKKWELGEKQKEKPLFGVLAGRSNNALSLIKNLTIGTFTSFICGS
jgi:hypothetical protein